MDVAAADRLLTTTRSVRKRLDVSRPVEPAVIARCIEIALQAPTGSNAQGWSFVVVTDAAKRKGLADLYKRAFQLYAGNPDLHPQYAADDPRGQQMPRVLDSATWLAEHLHEVPVHVVPCIDGRVENAGPLAQASVYGSILPAAWSFMLAARSRGLGTTLTTLTLMHDQEMAGILELPDGIGHCALIPVAYYTGDTFQRVERLPVRTVAYLDRWHQAFPG